MHGNPKKPPKRDMVVEARRAVKSGSAFIDDAKFAMMDGDLRYAIGFADDAVRKLAYARGIAETILSVKRNTDEQVVDLAEIIDDVDELMNEALLMRAQVLRRIPWPEITATNPIKRRAMR